MQLLITSAALKRAATVYLHFNRKNYLKFHNLGHSSTLALIEMHTTHSEWHPLGNSPLLDCCHKLSLNNRYNVAAKCQNFELEPSENLTTFQLVLASALLTYFEVLNFVHVLLNQR